MRIKYTWKQFDVDIKRLVEIYEGYGGLIKNVYGIPRGGLIPAVALAHRINKPLITDKKKIGRGTVIVDDIFDTGKTIRNLIRVTNQGGFIRRRKYFDIVVLWISKDILDAEKGEGYIRIKKSKDWVIFPWETNKSTK